MIPYIIIFTTTMSKCFMSRCKNTSGLSIYNGNTVCLKCKTEWIAEETTPNCYLCEREYFARVDDGQEFDNNTNPEYAYEGGKLFLKDGKNEIKYFICGECMVTLRAHKEPPRCEICVIYGKHGETVTKIKNLGNKKINVCNNCQPKVETILDVFLSQ